MRVNDVVKVVAVILSALLIVSGILLTFFDHTSTNANIGFVMIGAVLLLTMHPRLHGLKFGTTSVELSKVDNEKIASGIATELGPQIQDAMANEGHRYINHQKAFHDALAIVNNSITHPEHPLAEIELRLITVAMCYSWDFINRDFVPLVRQHSNVQFMFRIAMMRPDYLAQFDLDTRQHNWTVFSRNLSEKIDGLNRQLQQEGVMNLTLETFHYDGFPHHHGLLVNAEHLFLGNTDWDWNGQSRKPRLTAGSNPYRYYKFDSIAGKERIKTFRHWFAFYTKFDILNCLQPKEPSASSEGKRNPRPLLSDVQY